MGIVDHVYLIFLSMICEIIANGLYAILGLVTIEIPAEIVLYILIGHLLFAAGIACLKKNMQVFIKSFGLGIACLTLFYLTLICLNYVIGIAKIPDDIVKIFINEQLNSGRFATHTVLLLSASLLAVIGLIRGIMTFFLVLWSPALIFIENTKRAAAKMFANMLQLNVEMLTVIGIVYAFSVFNFTVLLQIAATGLLLKHLINKFEERFESICETETLNTQCDVLTTEG